MATEHPSGQYKLDVRVYHHTQVIDNSLYLWAGDSDDLPDVHNSEEKKKVTSHVEVFDITTGKWNNQTIRGNPPLGVDGYFCATVDNKIYYFGGYCGHDKCFHNSLNELNISTLTWTQLQPTDDRIAVMKRSNGGMISSKGAGQHCLLLIGGFGSPPSIQLPQAQYYQYPYGKVSTNEHNIYDLTTGQWIIPEIIGQSMPPNANFVMEAVNNTRAIIFGGMVEGTSSNTLYILDINNHTVHWETITKPDLVVQWPKERLDHAASIITGSISPILVMIGGLDKTRKAIKDCWILDINEKSWTKINLPDSVTERYGHSLSTFIMEPHCVWLIVVGGKLQFQGADVTDPNITMLIELVLNDGQWSVEFVLDSKALSVTNVVYDNRKPQKKSEKDLREESSQEKELESNYRKDLLVAQENIKSLQERLLDIESQQVQEKDNYITELQKKDEIITTLQSNQQISTTSYHHNLQQLHDLVQQKDRHIAQLNRKVVTLSKEKEDTLQKLKVTSHQLLTLRSSQKTTDVVSYLPKLAVVLQPVQEYWEQLGLQLNIDQSILTDIRSKGDSTEQMKYLLEEWSLKGGTLTQLEETLLHLDMKHVIPSLIDLQDKIQTSIDFSDKSIQCDYWNYTNISDSFEGMVTVGKKLCLYNAHTEHELILEQCGLRLVIPGEVITPIESIYEVAAQALWGAGKFEFPKGSTLISGVCYISVSSSSELNKPVTVELMHCANITDERQTQYLSFVAAKSGPPFKFYYLPGGSFSSESQCGTISLKQFSLLAIVLIIAGGTAAAVSGAVVGGGAAAVLGGAALVVHLVGGLGDDIKYPNCYYQAYIFYKRMGPKKWHMNLAVTQDTQYSKCLQDMSSNDDFGEKHSHFRFHFATNTLLSREQEETVERESDTEMVLKLSGFPADDVISTGWRVQPLRMPPLINRRDVDDFNQSKSASPPYIPVLICAYPNTSDFEEQLQYPLTIEGINVTDTRSQRSANSNQPKIVLDVSLDDYSSSTTDNKDTSRGLESTTDNTEMISSKRFKREDSKRGSSISHDEGVKHSAADDTLNYEICRRTLVQCTDIIVVSNIDPIALARKLYSKEIISEDVYKIVKDKKTGDTTTDRLDYILDDLKDHVKHNTSTFMIFLDILRDDSLNQQDLADKIMSKYKELAT